MRRRATTRYVDWILTKQHMIGGYMIRAIAMFVILAFASCVIAAGFMAAPASAGKMNGKPGGGPNVAHYGNSTGNSTGKPPAKMKKPATAQ
jgi:hypothetical protein